MGESMVSGGVPQEPNSTTARLRSGARRTWRWVKDNFTSEPTNEKLRSLDDRAQLQATAIEIVSAQLADLARDQQEMLKALERQRAMFERAGAALERLEGQNAEAARARDEVARTAAEIRTHVSELRTLPADLASARLELTSSLRNVERGQAEEFSRLQVQVNSLAPLDQVRALVNEGALAQSLASTRSQLVNELQKVQQVLAVHAVDVRDQLAVIPSAEHVRTIFDEGIVARELATARTQFSDGLRQVNETLVERVAAFSARLDSLPTVEQLQSAVNIDALDGKIAEARIQAQENAAKVEDVVAQHAADVKAQFAALATREQVHELVNNGTIARELASAWTQLVEGLQKVQETVVAQGGKVDERLAALPDSNNIRDLVNGGRLAESLAEARSALTLGMQQVGEDAANRMTALQRRLDAVPTGDDIRGWVGSGAVIQEVNTAKVQLSEGIQKLQQAVSDNALHVQSTLAKLPSTEQVHAFVEGGTASSVQSTRKLLTDESQRNQAVADRMSAKLSYLQSRSVVPLASQGLVMCRSALGYVAVPADDVAMVGALADGVIPKSGVMKFIEKHLKPGGTFVDVGANVGMSSLLAARAVGATGSVIAIEPAPVALKALRSTLRANGVDGIVRVEDAAAGDARGLATLAIMSDCRRCTLLLSEPESGSVVVTTLPLDEMLEGTVPDVIKVDVAGWEQKVFEGMQALLQAHPETLVVLNFEPAHIRATGLSSASWIERVAGAGFQIYEIDERSGEVAPLRKSGVEEVVSMQVLITRSRSFVRDTPDNWRWEGAGNLAAS